MSASSPSNQQFSVLQQCADQWSAVAMQNLLLEAGIQSHRSGTDAATALGMGGAPTSQLIRVSVASEELAKAKSVLEAHEQLVQSRDAWSCPRCDETNEPSFDVCWKCHAQYSPDHSSPTASVDVKDSPLTADPFSVPDAERTNQRKIQTDNPYAATTLTSGGRFEAVLSVDAGHADEEEQREVYRLSVRRALLASITAVFVFPPLLSVLPIYLLWKLPGRPSGVPFPMGKIGFTLLVTLVGILWGTIYWSIALLP